MTGRINYTPEARQQLDDLDEWIAKAASPAVAQQFVRQVLDHVEGILVFPRAGTPRDDIRAGMRTTSYKKRTLIAYDVEDSGSNVVVNIVGVFHGGQDWEAALRGDPSEPDS